MAKKTYLEKVSAQAQNQGTKHLKISQKNDTSMQTRREGLRASQGSRHKYLKGKRDLLTWQKRPTYMAKVTYLDKVCAQAKDQDTNISKHLQEKIRKQKMNRKISFHKKKKSLMLGICGRKGFTQLKKYIQGGKYYINLYSSLNVFSEFIITLYQSIFLLDYIFLLEYIQGGKRYINLSIFWSCFSLSPSPHTFMHTNT